MAGSNALETGKAPNVFAALLEKARAEGASTDEDIKAELLLFGALHMRDVEDAKKLLILASDCMERGDRPPRIVELYFAHAFRNILNGGDPRQEFHLKANHRKPLSIEDCMEVFFNVHHAKSQGLSEANALREFAKKNGMTAAAAEKRLSKAKTICGPMLTTISDGLRRHELASPNSEACTFTSLLLKKGATPKADKIIGDIVQLLSGPKKG